MRPKRTSPLPRVALTCDRCGTSFTRAPSDAKKYSGTRAFCSRTCYRPSSPPILNDDGLTARVPLYGGDGSVRAYALIDAVDTEWIGQWRWHLLPSGYPRRSVYIPRTANSPYRVVHRYMHCDLLGLTQGDGVDGDHINRNKLDNRRRNLRVVPEDRANAQNVPSQKGSTSAFRGVSWKASNRKWSAQLRVDGKTVYLGLFEDEAEAAAVAREARRRLMPYAVD